MVQWAMATAYTFPATTRGIGTISHDRGDETLEAKARWFASLPMTERMEMFCSFTDLALAVNPGLLEKRHAQSTSGRFQILSAP